MKTNPEEQLSQLLKIENEQERMITACAKFESFEISAKTIRAYFELLNSDKKIRLLHMLYNSEARKSNMERIPPKILRPESIRMEENYDVMLCSDILKYEIIHMYESSKTKQQFYRFRNVIARFLKEPSINISGFSEEFMENAGSKNSRALKYDVGERIKGFAIESFVKELMDKKEKADTSSLNLPSAMTIGAELEFVGPSNIELTELMSVLQEYGIYYLKDFVIKHDGSVFEFKKDKTMDKLGAEVVSPILDDTENSWVKLNNACRFLQAIGSRVNRTCGGHIHIGENVMGVDKEAWKTFLKVWSEAEPLIYAISNRRGEYVRTGTHTYAAETSGTIDCIDWSNVRIKKESDVEELSRNVSEGDRYKSLNLINIASNKKNTIEFRLSNGTIDYNILRENILLYGRLIQMAKMHSIDPSRKKKQLEAFFEDYLTEKQKLERFLDLVFDSEEEKKIFYDRWKSKANEYASEMRFYNHSSADFNTRQCNLPGPNGENAGGYGFNDYGFDFDDWSQH